MFKNVASQKIAVFAFDTTTGAAKTGDAANITVYVSKDWGTVTALGDTSATEMDSTNAKGWYLFDVTQGETNADALLFSGKSSTANISIVGQLIWTTPANFSTLSVDGSGRVDVIKIAGTTQTARDIGASVLLSTGTGTGQLDFTSGVVKANLAQILGTALTETAGLLAGGFKKFFNVATPTGTLNSIPDVVAGAAGGLFIAGTNAATTITTSLTTTFTGNLTGSVGSVTGAVGSVTGAVGSVTGNVGGNVVGSVASVTAGVTLTSGERNSVADALLDRDMSTGADNGSTTVRTVRQALRFLRNKWDIAAGTLTVKKEDDATTSWTASISSDAAAVPVIGSDPAGP